MLTKVAKEHGYTELLIFSDDGVTGTTMKRPGFQAMIQEIERGNIGAVFVIGQAQQTAETEQLGKQKELKTLQKRDAELDTLFQRIYEDICCKGRKSNPSNTVKAAGSSVAVWGGDAGGGDQI